MKEFNSLTSEIGGLTGENYLVDFMNSTLGFLSAISREDYVHSKSISNFLVKFS